MKSFGNIKTRILKQLTEAYVAKDGKQISKILKLIKENKDFLDLYNFYDDVEEKYFDDVEVAKLYVEEISNLLSQKSKNIQETCQKFESILTENEANGNELYDALDQLLGTNNIRNLDKKLVAKKKVVNFLTTEKTNVEEVKSDNYTLNESLLSTILISNFNSKYADVLSEEDKKEFKEIVSLTNEEVEEKINDLRESLNEKIDTLLTENKDVGLKTKLTEVKQRVDEMDYSRLSYYKIKQLEKDL